jgi:predicted DCC family thiol-disulfide oxidoreductase YuxK
MRILRGVRPSYDFIGESVNCCLLTTISLSKTRTPFPFYDPFLGFLDTMSSHEIPFARSGWVLYDGSCGFCKRWVPFWAPTLRRLGYDIAPLQSPWVSQHLGLSDSVLTQDLRLLFSDGTQVQGADVYRHIMRQIWWAYPFYLLAAAPGTSTLFDLGYRTFAINRFRFSKACGFANNCK